MIVAGSRLLGAAHERRVNKTPHRYPGYNIYYLNSGLFNAGLNKRCKR